VFKAKVMDYPFAQCYKNLDLLVLEIGMGIIGLDYDFGSPYMHLGKSCVAPNVAHHLNNFVNNN
jgi:hypothetical protein